jgi:hypothetical protein
LARAFARQDCGPLSMSRHLTWIPKLTTICL